jgi:hypothetical protein
VHVDDGLGITLDVVQDLPPLQSGRLSDDDLACLAHLGHNGSRDVEGPMMTHCVPDERAVRVRAATPGRTGGPVPAGTGPPVRPWWRPKRPLATRGQAGSGTSRSRRSSTKR